jgi:hypothetical protein
LFSTTKKFVGTTLVFFNCCSIVIWPNFKQNPYMTTQINNKAEGVGLGSIPPNLSKATSFSVQLVHGTGRFHLTLKKNKYPPHLVVALSGTYIRQNKYRVWQALF